MLDRYNGIEGRYNGVVNHYNGLVDSCKGLVDRYNKIVDCYLGGCIIMLLPILFIEKPSLRVLHAVIIT